MRASEGVRATLEKIGHSTMKRNYRRIVNTIERVPDLRVYRGLLQTAIGSHQKIENE